MEVGQVGCRWRRLRLLLTGAALFALVIAGTGCDEGDVEEVLGDISATSIESAYPVDSDPLINDWLTNRGHTIVSHTPRQNIPYEFSVVETDLVNAFAAPYGHVYVTTGFLDFADTEDEVAVVLAHEVGHIVNRDSIHSFKNSLLWGVVTQIISGKSRAAGDVLGIGLGLLSLQYSRDAEYAADDAGTRYAYAVGYDPARGLDFFNRLMTDVEKRRPSRWEVYFSTHPRTEDRIARQLKREEMSDTSSESLLWIARGYLLRGQPSKASMLLEKGLELAPDLPEAQTLLGDALARRGDRVGARAAYEQAMRLSGGLRSVRASATLRRDWRRFRSFLRRHCPASRQRADSAPRHCSPGFRRSAQAPRRRFGAYRATECRRMRGSMGSQAWCAGSTAACSTSLMTTRA